MIKSFKCKETAKIFKYKNDDIPWEKLDDKSRSRKCDNIKNKLKKEILLLITIEDLEKYNDSELKELFEKISLYL